MKSGIFYVLLSIVVANVIQGCHAKKEPVAVYLDPMQPQWPNAPQVAVDKWQIGNVQTDPIFGAWIAHHERALRRLRMNSSITKGITCRLTISHDGIVSNLKVEKSSGSPTDDEAALVLLRALGQFQPLPGSWDKQTFLVEFKESPAVRFSRVE
jgi:outer membrane biosynthesis protein TonB